VESRLLIDGAWLEAAGAERLPVEDPSTAEIIREVALGRPADADAAVGAARRAFDEGPWPALRPAERGQVLRRLGELLEANAGEFAQIIEDEVGTVRSMARAIQVDRPMANFWDLVERGSHDLDRELASVEGEVDQIIAREPRGVVSVIVPWNFPHFLDIWKVAPALVTGNTVVLKPALETPGVALELGRLALEAGVPPGVLNVVTGGPDVGELLVTDPRVDMVSFTGSTVVGRAIAAAAGATVKHVVLELGGKSALVALADADLDGVTESAMRFVLNSGQGCALNTRLVVADAIHDEVVDRLVSVTGALTVGSAHDEASQVGPVISAAQRERVEGYITLGREAGAKIAVGGGRPPVAENGYYVDPTIFTEADNSMRVAREEIFGPVLCVIRFSGDPDEGVAIANDSEYGLAGSVWTADLEVGTRMARAIRAGKVNVNASRQSSVDAPFGGYKQSGVGRELGQIGLEEFTEVKHLAWGRT
jgi:aldehyde dehydrogenase (NAD+)